MSDPSKILYREAGPFERALAHAAGIDLPVPIRQILDPLRTFTPFLPFLAAHESVDLWFDDWSQDRKRRMIAAARDGLAGLKGTRAAAATFLSFVDTAIVHKRSYPSRAPVGRIAAGRTPVNHPDFTARFLLQLTLRAHRSAIVVGRSAVGQACVKTIDREPIRRARRAIVVSKAPETAYSVNFAHRKAITLDESFNLDAGHVLGSFNNRKTL